MSKRRRGDSLSVSLFPFLTILSCVIGTLTLIIAGLALGKIADDNGLGLEYFSIVRSREAAEEEYSLLQNMIEQAIALSRRIEDARAVLLRLEGKRETGGSAEADEVELLALLEERTKEIRSLETDLEILNARVRELSREAGARPGRSGKMVLLYPYGSGRNLTPLFVECTSAGLILNPDGYGRERRVVRSDEIDNSREFASFLRRVAMLRDHTAIFLVRPGGVENLDRAIRIATEKGTRHGFMPVPANQTLDYSRIRSSQNGM